MREVTPFLKFAYI